ncbi:olfactory receptor 2AT4-like [Electrophorus electricus]|uniref:olfactory receptor 2AT4-like n=1 Tax=Electrophorus electricus TaxID=8005 RepID=UPI0015CFE437|nr:olfactory receptor 2AT4-like [Electrophorus electricus]
MPEGNITTLKNFTIVGFPGLHHNYYGLVSAVMFIVYMCILVGNGTFLTLFAWEKSLQKPMYYIIINLSVCDVLFSTTTIPKIITKYWFNDGSISFLGYFIQMYFVHYTGSVIAFVLGIMAFDRYIAVCNPLRYAIIVKDSTVFILCIIAWLLAVPCILVMVIRAYSLPYCSTNTIIHCYCDHVSITRLACTDRTPYGLAALISSMFVLLVPLFFILFSYGSIVKVDLLISTNQGRIKTLSTCSSQLIITALFFLPRCFNYFASFTGLMFSSDIQILVILLYSLVPPMINPFIYCIRTKEVKKALTKHLARTMLIQFLKPNLHVSAIH